MKTFISTLIFTLLCPFIFAQKIQIEASKQDWANGICCAHGTNYTVVLKSVDVFLKKSDIISICIDGKKFSKKELTIKQTKSGNSYKLTIKFGYTEDSRKENNLYEEETPEVKNIKNYTNCTSKGITLKINGKIAFKPIKKIKIIPVVPRP